MPAFVTSSMACATFARRLLMHLSCQIAHTLAELGCGYCEAKIVGAGTLVQSINDAQERIFKTLLPGSR